MAFGTNPCLWEQSGGTLVRYSLHHRASAAFKLSDPLVARARFAPASKEHLRDCRYGMCTNVRRNGPH